MCRKAVAGVLLLVGAGTMVSGCGARQAASGPTTTTSTTAPAEPGALPAVGIGTSVTTTGPLPTTATGGSALPSGAATGYIFGTSVEGTVTRSNEPPTTADVDQARVNATATLGPIDFSTTDLARWPDACTLVTLGQLQTIDPSVTGLDGGPQPVFTGTDDGSGKSPRPNGCDFHLTTSFGPSTSSEGPTDVEVVFYTVEANEAAVYQQETPPTGSGPPGVNDPSNYVNYGNLGNGLSCNDASYSIVCDKGFVYFVIQGQKITGGRYPAVDNCVWADQMLIPVAEVLGRELTGT